MKAQVITKMTFPSYMKVEMFNDGFIVKVTRQINKKFLEHFQNFFKDYPAQCPAAQVKEAYEYNGRAYISCHRAYLKSDHIYPTDEKVLYAAEKMHCYLMSKYLECKAEDLLNRSNAYYSR